MTRRPLVAGASVVITSVCCEARASRKALGLETATSASVTAPGTPASASCTSVFASRENRCSRSSSHAATTALSAARDASITPLAPIGAPAATRADSTPAPRSRSTAATSGGSDAGMAVSR